MGLFGRLRTKDGRVDPHSYLHAEAMKVVPAAQQARSQWMSQLEQAYPTPGDAFAATLPALLEVEKLRGETRALSEIATLESRGGKTDPQLAALIEQTRRAVEWDWSTLSASCGMLLFHADENAAAVEGAGTEAGRLEAARHASDQFEEWWRDNRSSLVPPGVPTARDAYATGLEQANVALGGAFEATAGGF